MATSEVMLPLDFIMAEWGPWLYGSPVGWPDVFSFMRSEGTLHSTSEQIMRKGFETVTLGPDGMILSGQDQVVAAYMKGVRQLLCAFEFTDDLI